MSKEILFNKVSLVEKNANNDYVNILKDINFKIKDNEIVSFITPDEKAGSAISNILTNEKAPSIGDLSLVGEYFDYDFSFKDNRISKISKKNIKNIENSSKTAASFLNDGLKDKKSLKKVYNHKLNLLNDELIENKKLLKRIKSKKGFSD